MIAARSGYSIFGYETTTSSSLLFFDAQIDEDQSFFRAKKGKWVDMGKEYEACFRTYKENGSSKQTSIEFVSGAG